MDKTALSLLLAAALTALGCSDENPLSTSSEPPAAKLTTSSTTAAGTANTRPVDAEGLTITRDPVSGQPEGPVKTRRFAISSRRAGDGRSGPVKPLLETVRGQLRLDQPVQFEGLELTWLTIEDSRCPEGVNCITAGKVDITLAAKIDDEESGQVDLSLDPGQKDEARALVGKYAVQLLAVDPYPVNGVETERTEYSATVLVELPPPPRNVTVSEEEAGGGLPGEEFGGSGEHPEVAAALAANQAKWNEAALTSYTFNQQRLCFCLVEFVQQVTVEVADDQIQSINYVESGEAVTDAFDFYLTVPGLFALIDDALKRNADNIDVEFDEVLGYPSRINIDYDFRIADEEVTYTSENLVAN